MDENVDDIIAIEEFDRLNDFLFMKYMGEKGCEVQLTAFLNAVLERTGKNVLQTVEILENKTLTPEIIGDKTSILDVRARTLNGDCINIEVQVNNKGDMGKRSLYYWSLEYARSIAAGEVYDNLPSVIAINIVNYGVNTKNFHSSFHLWEDKDRKCKLTDVLEIHFVDMVKFRQLKRKDEKKSLHRWLEFFDNSTNSETLEKIIKMDTSIGKAYGKFVSATRDKEVLRAYQMRRMGQIDYNSGIAAATREGEAKGLAKGLAKGEAKGKAEARIELAMALLKDGTSIEKVAMLTQLTKEDIEKALLR